MIADAEHIEAIREFFTEWWTMEELYNTAASFSQEALSLLRNKSIGEEETKIFSELLNQHMMLLDLVKPFDGKESDEQ